MHQLNLKARHLRFQHLLSNKEMAELTKSSTYGSVGQGTVASWFLIANPTVPRLCYLNTIESEIRRTNFVSAAKSRKRNPNLSVELSFTMKEFRLSPQDISDFLHLDLPTVLEWVDKFNQQKPTYEQVLILRQRAIDELEKKEQLNQTSETCA